VLNLTTQQNSTIIYHTISKTNCSSFIKQILIALQASPEFTVLLADLKSIKFCEDFSKVVADAKEWLWI
jgi:2-C-methyl-D-erythritol 4-phosphate cytidylyltransferase